MQIEIEHGTAYGSKLVSYTFIGPLEAFLGRLYEYEGDYTWEQPNGLDSTLEASTLREAFQEIARYWKENSFIA